MRLHSSRRSTPNCMHFLSYQTWICPGNQAPFFTEGMGSIRKPRAEFWEVKRSFKGLFSICSPQVQSKWRVGALRGTEGCWGGAAWEGGGRGALAPEANREPHLRLLPSQVTPAASSPSSSSAVMLKNRKVWVKKIQFMQMERAQSTAGKKGKCYYRKG